MRPLQRGQDGKETEQQTERVCPALWNEAAAATGLGAGFATGLTADFVGTFTAGAALTAGAAALTAALGGGLGFVADRSGSSAERTAGSFGGRATEEQVDGG